MTEPRRCGPGLYDDVSAAEYHADPCPEPSLSSSIAKIIVTQTPMHAWQAHPRLNNLFKPEVDDKFDLGTAVHDWLASGGKSVHVIPGFKDWRTADAQAKRDAVRVAGKTALLEAQYDRAQVIVERARLQCAVHGIDLGMQEHVLIAESDGIWMRIMADSLHLPWINDWKVTKMNLADDRALARHIVGMGYDLRCAHYLHVAERVFPAMAGRIGFRWLFLEDAPPHGLRIIEADATIREMGRRKLSYAMKTWARCIGENKWPLYEGLPRTVAYPAYAESDWLEREIAMEEQGS